MNESEEVWTVADVMVEDVVSASPSTPFRELLDLLWLHEVSALPVLDERGVLAGIVAESDLLVRAEFEAGSGRRRTTRPRSTTSCGARHR